MKLSRFDRHTHRMIQFLAVVRHGSIHSAARSLNLTQPSLTKSISQLEKLLGVPLLDRSALGITPTKYGVVLKRYAEQLEAGLNHVEMEFDRIRGGQAGSLRIAAGAVWLNLVLPKVAAALQRHPGSPMLYCEPSGADSLDQLCRNDIDVLCGLAEPKLDEDPNFVYSLKARFPLCLIVKKGHPLTRIKGDNAVMKQAVHFPFVLLSHSVRSNLAFANFLKDHRLAFPRVAMNTGSPLSMFEVIRETNFIGFAALPLAKNANSRELAYIPLRSPVFQISVGVMHRRSLQKVGLFGIFMTELDAALKNLGISEKSPKAA